MDGHQIAKAGHAYTVFGLYLLNLSLTVMEKPFKEIRI